MILTTPVATPVTIPVRAPTLAVPGALLLQTPPPTGSVRVIVFPVQTTEGPDITDGVDRTVTVVVLIQPVDGNV